jgi:hypothetical protein
VKIIFLAAERRVPKWRWKNTGEAADGYGKMEAQQANDISP